MITTSAVAKVLNYDIVVSSNYSNIITFTFSRITLGNDELCYYRPKYRTTAVRLQG